jgi:hypothetical protein
LASYSSTCYGYWVYPLFSIWGEAMTREKISEYRQKLRTILNKDEGQRFEELKQLAKEVGAGYVHTEIAPTTTTVPDGNGFLTTIHKNPISISESELVLNINNALQTETMIDMCNTAAKNHRITVAAAIAAVLGALAAWAAIVKMVR